MIRSLAVAALASAGFLAGAQAQSTRYDLTEMNFDMWCQEEQHLPPERCDKRLPADDAAFEAYRNKIESYEIPYLQEKENKQQFNRVILHNDPVDHPTEVSKPQTQQPSHDNTTGE
ncbi:MAG TPA: hypothetical protein VMH86_08085 [Rhizomicrobium sp.]|nr:hypothetical protein [Rhizomicrobium sp.]